MSLRDTVRQDLADIDEDVDDPDSARLTVSLNSPIVKAAREYAAAVDPARFESELLPKIVDKIVAAGPMATIDAIRQAAIDGFLIGHDNQIAQAWTDER